MILYKYMSESAGLKVLQHNSVGFTQPNKFNDPFETAAAYPPTGDNEIDVFLSSIRSWAKRVTWTENSGVLCLTRDPVNPLMWSHYSDEHKGLVVGIDVQIAGFTDESCCLIPAQFGSIVYTQTRPRDAFSSSSSGEPISVGRTHFYPRGHEEKIARLFLQKPMCWSYEEEVRVVKCVSEIDAEGASPSGDFQTLELDDRKLFLFQLPKGSIREVYLGVRHTAWRSASKVTRYIEMLRSYQESVEIYGCRLAKKTWNIERFDPEKVVAEILHPSRRTPGAGEPSW